VPRAARDHVPVTTIAARTLRCGRVHCRDGRAVVGGGDVGRRHDVVDDVLWWRRTVLATTDRRRVVGARVGQLVDDGRCVTTCYTDR